jgi:small-conductance mechanosensitive channel
VAGLIIKSRPFPAGPSGQNRFVTKLYAQLGRILLILAVMTFGLAQTSRAQTAGDTAPAGDVVTQQQAVLDGLKARIDDLQARIEARRDDDSSLVEIRLQLDDISAALLRSGLAFRPRLADINAKLEQLGPAPAEGQPPEPEIVASQRKALIAEKAEINAALGIAESLSVRVNSLVARIAELRRDLFARLLTHRYELNADLFGEVVDAFYGEAAKLNRTLAAWLRFVLQFKLNSLLAAAFFALCAAVPLVGGRRLFGSLLHADPAVPSPSYLSRLSVAFWTTLLQSAAVVAFLGATYFCFDFYNVLRGDVGRMIVALFNVIAVVFFITRLARAALSPGLPQWRLVHVETRAAHWLFWLIFAIATVNGIDYLLSAIYDVLGSPLSLTVGESLAATVLVGILVVMFGFTRPFRAEDGSPRPWPRPVKYLFIGLGLLTVASSLLGYIGFAKFLAQQIVITGAILATMYLGFRTAGAAAEEGALAHATLGKSMQRRFSLDDTTLDQLGLAAGVVLQILVVVVGVPLILLQWGFQWGDIRSWAYALASGLRVGSVTISLVGILTGIVVFVVGYFLTRWFRIWLDGSVMARGRLDAGVRNSIRTAVGYAGVLIAALLGISAAGIDLSNFALIAGGLSLGLGFGLQNVVSNFVSGLILLAERPFKVGDWIVAGDISGTVKKISVRATEIETFQRQTLIVPNSQFINSAVGNWTHRNKLGRLEIAVGVAYGSDPRKVHELLLGIARSHPLVLRNPEPFVLFTNFGDSSLDFEVRVFLADVMNGVIVQNDLRFAIVEAFDREGITIPFPQREVLLKTETNARADTAAHGPAASGKDPGPAGREAGGNGRPAG